MKKNLLSYLKILILLLISNAIHAKTNVLITVDIESFSSGNPTVNILGELIGYEGQYGVPKIIKILDQNNTTGTFYLNVYEVEKHGDKQIKQVAKDIVLLGHDLQLHTHPEYMFGKKGLSNYNLDVQTEILLKGKKLIHQWTGKQVLAHRAGGFKANKDTIKALKKTGIFVDSSLSPASFSPLSKSGFSANDIIEIAGVIEIPATYFIQIKVGNFESLRFLDIESTSLAELKLVLSELAANNSCVANIMMHSFSLTRYGYPDERIINKLNSLLKFINNHPNLETISTSEFIKSYKNNSLSCSSSPKFVPHTGIILTYLRSWERFGDGWKNVIVALSLPVLIVTILILGLIIKLTRRTT